MACLAFELYHQFSKEPYQTFFKRRAVVFCTVEELEPFLGEELEFVKSGSGT
jgi:hypothetical protein